MTPPPRDAHLPCDRPLPRDSPPPRDTHCLVTPHLPCDARCPVTAHLCALQGHLGSGSDLQGPASLVCRAWAACDSDKPDRHLLGGRRRRPQRSPEPTVPSPGSCGRRCQWRLDPRPSPARQRFAALLPHHRLQLPEVRRAFSQGRGERRDPADGWQDAPSSGPFSSSSAGSRPGPSTSAPPSLSVV